MPQIPDHYDAGAVDVFDGDPLVEIPDGAVKLAEQRFFTASDDPRVVALRLQIQRLGALIDTIVPPGRNKSLALTALEDVQMRANRGIFAPEDLR